MACISTDFTHAACQDRLALAQCLHVLLCEEQGFLQRGEIVRGVRRAGQLRMADWRLTLTTALLRDGHPLKLVTEEVGFASPSSLSRAFKQRFGVCPRQWIGSGSTEVTSRG